MDTLLYALGAGVLSTFNPCAYTLLPAVLGRFLARREQNPIAGLRLGLALTAGTLVVFGAVAALVATLGVSVGRVFPYLAVALAALFLMLATRILAGRPAGLTLAARLPDPRHDSTWRGPFLYGLAFGLASLGCALPIFLTVVALSISHGPTLALAAISLYGLSMGATLMILCLAAMTGQTMLLAKAKALGRLIDPLGGVLLLFAAGYLIYLNIGYLAFDYRLSSYLAWSAGAISMTLGLAWRFRRSADRFGGRTDTGYTTRSTNQPAG